MMMTKYQINYWGSHPDEGHDDCHSGVDCATMKNAMYFFNQEVVDINVEYVELCESTGRTINGAIEVVRLKIRANPNYKPRKDDDDDWRREMAMEAGMLHGVNAYNDMMGYSLDDEY